LSPDTPDAAVVEQLTSFYRTNESYANRQAEHSEEYFARLLAVMRAVLTVPAPSILEIGAGTAGALRIFRRSTPGARAIALELSPASLCRATNTDRGWLQPVAGSALRLPFGARSVDAVVAFEVIEHLPNVPLALDEMLRVVKRPGWVIIGLPNHASLWTPLQDALLQRNRLAFGVERGRGALRWWRRNAKLAWRKRRSARAEFLYRAPVLDATRGGDADAVYYAAPVDLLRFFNARGARLAATSAEVRFGPAGRWIPVELQGSTVFAWRV
jgi:SAM-dependent methyltransferase